MNHEVVPQGGGEALRVEGLSVGFDGRRVVDDVTLTVRDGEVLTLVGPSGCGKSTLTRLIAGLERHDAGRVLLGGRDVSDLAAEDRRIGLVFQEAALFGHLRVAANIAFGVGRLPRAERDARVAEMLELVGLGGFEKRHPHELSGGEQQRVALARALAPGPRVLLLDEPFANLDEVLRDDLRRHVAEILRATGTASVLVTHDRREALSLGDSIAVMREGRIVQCGAPSEVYDTPVDRFVASFMDDTTFLPAPGGSVSVVRPHQVHVVHGGPDRVERVEFLGARCRYEVRRRDGSSVIAEGDGRDCMSVGDPCTASIDHDALHRVP